MTSESCVSSKRTGVAVAVLTVLEANPLSQQEMKREMLQRDDAICQS